MGSPDESNKDSTQSNNDVDEDGKGAVDPDLKVEGGDESTAAGGELPVQVSQGLSTQGELTPSPLCSIVSPAGRWTVLRPSRCCAIRAEIVAEVCVNWRCDPALPQNYRGRCARHVRALLWSRSSALEPRLQLLTGQAVCLSTGHGARRGCCQILRMHAYPRAHAVRVWRSLLGFVCTPESACFAITHTAWLQKLMSSAKSLAPTSYQRRRSPAGSSGLTNSRRPRPS